MVWRFFYDRLLDSYNYRTYIHNQMADTNNEESKRRRREGISRYRYLKERYAKSEIGKSQFENMKADLGH